MSCTYPKDRDLTERNNVQQVFILTRNRPLNGVQNGVLLIPLGCILTGIYTLTIGNTLENKGSFSSLEVVAFHLKSLEQQ